MQTQPQNITVEATSIETVLTHGTKLFEEHYDEIAKHKDVQQLKPDAARYMVMAHRLLVFAAYNERREMVGYSVSMLDTHLHYKDTTVCHNDVLFVTEAARRTRAGLKLIAATEEAAREQGAHLMGWHAKPDTTLAALLDRSPDYQTQDIIFTRKL